MSFQLRATRLRICAVGLPEKPTIIIHFFVTISTEFKWKLALSSFHQGEKEDDKFDSCLSLPIIRAVPRFFWLRGQSPPTFTGVSRIQTGFLVGRFAFTPKQKVASKTFKETNHTDTFLFNCHDLLWHKHLVWFEIAPEVSATQ